MKHQRILAISVCTLALSACATGDSFNRGQTGAVAGAVAGAVLGHQVDGDKGRFVGAVVGAIAGNAVGRYMDEQQEELERELRAEQDANEIRISRLPDNSLKLDVSNEVSFDFDSSVIKVGFRGSLDKVAAVLADYPSTAVHIAGHTDSTGTEQYNQLLSERRASSVKDYLVRSGVQSSRALQRGYGETQPIADNNNEAGRQRNRRVEIYLKPIIEGNEAEAFRSPV